MRFIEPVFVLWAYLYFVHLGFVQVDFRGLLRIIGYTYIKSWTHEQFLLNLIHRFGKASWEISIACLW